MPSTPPFHFDNARTVSEEDEFDFKSLGQRLAESLAALLSQPAQKSSFVLGLEGRWGSGKTTILNYIRSELERSADTCRHFFIDFDPWWLEEGTNIPAALLMAVLASLPKDDAKKNLHAIGRLASAAGKLPEGIDVVLRLSKRTERAAELLDAVRKAGGDVGKIIDGSKPVRRLRADVARAFEEKGYRFIIFIDDLDRLSPSQALQVMSAIRSIADLPGFTYVLAYDPHALQNILRNSDPPLGHDYFDKIVNISVPVPLVTYDQMQGFTLKLLANPLSESLVRPDSAAHRAALFALLDAPRDAIRLANAVNFWVGGKTEEVFAPDFVLLEAVRLARPEAYAGLQRTSDVWLAQSGYDPLGELLNRDRDEPARRAEVAARVDRELALQVSEDDAKVRTALSVLFPKAARFLGEQFRFVERADGPDDERRISNRRHFFTYFLHRPLPGAPTRGEIASLLDPQADYEQRAAKLIQILGRPSGDVQPAEYVIAVIEAEDERGSIPVQVAMELVRALNANTGDKLNAIGASERLLTDVDLTRGFATRTFQRARQLTDVEVRTLFDPTLSVTVLGSLHLVITAGTRFYLLDDPGNECIVAVSDRALEFATAVLIERIFGAIESGELFASSIAPRLLHMAFKNDPEGLKSALQPVFQDDERTARLVESYAGFSNPFSSLRQYSGYTATELKVRVKQAASAARGGTEGWSYWRWFKNAVEE